MESGTIAPGADAETQERMRKEAEDADRGADMPGEGDDAAGAEAKGDQGKDAEPEQEIKFPKPEILGEGQLSLSVGGESPDTSLVKMTGVEIQVPNGGQFKKGQFLDVVLRVRVAGVHIDDKFDNATGTVTGTTRKHILKPLRVERVD
jgi:hypothetical protein